MNAAGAYLKEHTREAHVATETLLLGNALHDRSVSLARYRRLIRVSNLIWEAAHRTLSDCSSASPFLEPVSLLTGALSRDARLLQLPEPPPGIVDFPVPTNAAETFGTLYVLLGSTLGGRVIARRLRECPELRGLSEFHFYGACAALPPTLWPRFKSELDWEIREKEELIRCGERATRVFRLYAEVYG